MVSPTALDPRSKYWYVPDDQQKLSDMMDDIQWTQISKFPQNTYRLNIDIRKDDLVCEMLSNGAFYYWDISGTENSFLGENKNLYNEILWVLQEKLSFKPLDQVQITDLIAAEVVYTQQNTGITFTQRITDNDTLRLFEDQFQSATPLNGLTACPFYEAIMTLEKKDGTTLSSFAWLPTHVRYISQMVYAMRLRAAF